MLKLLQQIGWTQAELARRLGAAPNTVNEWCQHEPDTLAFRAAMRYLELVSKLIS